MVRDVHFLKAAGELLGQQSYALPPRQATLGMARTKVLHGTVDVKRPLAIAAVDTGVQQRIAIVHTGGRGPRRRHLTP